MLFLKDILQPRPTKSSLDETMSCPTENSQINDLDKSLDESNDSVNPSEINESDKSLIKVAMKKSLIKRVLNVHLVLD